MSLDTYRFIELGDKISKRFGTHVAMAIGPEENGSKKVLAVVEPFPGTEIELTAIYEQRGDSIRNVEVRASQGLSDDDSFSKILYDFERTTGINYWFMNQRERNPYFSQEA